MKILLWMGYQEKKLILCGGECYNPSSERLNITRIEVIKITPQISSDEKVDDLIQDPWLVLPCDGDNGCEVEFEDPSFIENDRHSIYYVRAIQEPTDTINGDNLRCKYDSEGNCIEGNPCWGDYRVDSNDACLSKASIEPGHLQYYISKNNSNVMKKSFVFFERIGLCFNFIGIFNPDKKQKLSDDIVALVIITLF